MLGKLGINADKFNEIIDDIDSAIKLGYSSVVIFGNSSDSIRQTKNYIKDRVQSFECLGGDIGSVKNTCQYIIGLDGYGEIHHIDFDKIKLEFLEDEIHEDITIIVPLYNQWAYLDRLLKSICQQFTASQILIMDDKSPEPATQEYLDKIEKMGVVVERNKNNLGFGQNCNKGVRLAKTKYIALLNSDVWREEGDPIGDCLEVLKANDDVGIVGCMLLQGNKIHHGGIYMDWSTVDGTPRHIYCGELPQDYMKRIDDVEGVTGAFWIFRKSEFEELGGFYKGYGRGYFEDPDLCCAYRKAGFRIVCNNKVSMQHACHISFADIGFPFDKTEKNLRLFQDRWLDFIKKDVKNRVAIYTCITGDVDEPKEHEFQSINHRYYHFTGVKKYKLTNLQSKHYKVFPEQFVDEGISIWIDGNIKITDKDFAKFLIDELGDNDMMTLNIEGRDTLMQEVLELRKNPKYDKLPLENQIDSYKMKNYKMFGCGIIVRRHNEKVRLLEDMWWGEICRWTIRDQLSLPYVASKNKDVKIKILNINKIRKYCEWSNHN